MICDGWPMHSPRPITKQRQPCCRSRNTGMGVWNALYGEPSRSVTALLTALRAAGAPFLTPHVATCPPLVTPLHAGGLGLSL